MFLIVYFLVKKNVKQSFKAITNIMVVKATEASTIITIYGVLGLCILSEVIITRIT